MAASVGTDHFGLEMLLDKYVVVDVLQTSADYPTAFGFVSGTYAKKLIAL